MCVAYLNNTWQQDALWEEEKLVEAVRCFGHVLLGKLGSFTLGKTYHLPKHSCRLGTLSWKQYALMAVASFSSIIHLATKQKWFRNGLRSTTMSLKSWFGLQIQCIWSGWITFCCNTSNWSEKKRSATNSSFCTHSPLVQMKSWEKSFLSGISKH